MNKESYSGKILTAVGRMFVVVVFIGWIEKTKDYKSVAVNEVVAGVERETREESRAVNIVVVVARWKREYWW